MGPRRHSRSSEMHSCCRYRCAAVVGDLVASLSESDPDLPACGGDCTAVAQQVQARPALLQFGTSRGMTRNYGNCSRHMGFPSKLVRTWVKHVLSRID